MIRFGPAGWSYKDWAGIVYPQPKPKEFDELQYMAGYFETIEVNSTFYRPASRRTAESWLRRTRFNPDFRFTAKLWKRFTHERKEAWTEADVRQARDAFDPMLDAGKLGALLLQFPWSFRRTDENREWLDDLLTTFTEFPLVVEVRHASWNEPAFFAELGERGVGFVNIDQPLFGNSIAPSARATSQVGYVRVHGRNYREWFRKDAAPEARYDYLYSAEELRPWAERVDEVAQEEGTHDVYVVTNNHFRGKGITNALMLKSMVQKEKVPAPPELFGEYAGVLEEYAEPGGPPVRPA